MLGANEADERVKGARQTGRGRFRVATTLRAMLINTFLEFARTRTRGDWPH